MSLEDMEERIQTAIGLLVCQGVMQKSEAEKIRARHKRKKKGEGVKWQQQAECTPKSSN